MTRAADIGLPVVGLAVTLAIWPGFLAPAITAKWLVLGAVVPILWATVARPAIAPAAHALGLGWLTFAAIGLGFRDAHPDGVLAVWHLAILAAAFSLAGQFSIGGFRAFLMLIAVGGAINGAVAIIQSAAGVPVLGLMGNVNLLAELGLIGALAATARALRGGGVRGVAFALALLPLNGVALAGAAWPPTTKTVVVGALAAALALAFRAARGWWRFGAGFALAAAAGAVLAALTVADASLSSYAFRLNIWHDVIANLSLGGVGIGGFAAAFPAWADASQGAPFLANSLVRVAYNDALQLVAELGVVAVLPMALAAFILKRGFSDDPTALTVVAAILGLGLVNYPLHTPTLGFVLACCAGYLCRRGADAGAGAGHRRDAADGVASEPRAFRQGVAGAAGRSAFSLFARDPRSERAPGRDGASHAAADRPSGAPQCARSRARQSDAAGQAGGCPLAVRRSAWRAGIGRRIRQAFSPSAGSPNPAAAC